MYQNNNHLKKICDLEAQTSTQRNQRKSTEKVKINKQVLSHPKWQLVCNVPVSNVDILTQNKKMHAVKFICFILVPAAWPSVIQLFIGIVVPSGAHIIKKKFFKLRNACFLYTDLYSFTFIRCFIFLWGKYFCLTIAAIQLRKILKFQYHCSVKLIFVSNLSVFAV